MKGRYEHSKKIKNHIEKLLEDAPQILKDYYQVISIQKEQTTCLEYVNKIKSFLVYTNKEIKNITDVDVAIYLSNKNLGESTAQAQVIYTALNGFFKYCKLKGMVENNPLSLIGRPQKSKRKKKNYLSISELNDILEMVNTGCGNHNAKTKQKKWKERDYLILFLFMNTGMRKTALSEINIEDIDFNNNKLTIIDKRNKEQIYDITPEIREIIDDWLFKREQILNGENEDALFISNRKERMSDKAIYDIVNKYSEAALGYAISPHCLRGAFITMVYENNGHDIEATRQAVGHSSIETTSLYITQKNNPRSEAISFISNSLRR